MHFDFLIDLEKKLLHSSFRRNKTVLEDMLHPDFFEFGASGKKWDRATTIESLIELESTEHAASNFVVHRISENAALVTYITDANGQKALRSSIWKKSGDTWKIFFHQGTQTA